MKSCVVSKSKASHVSSFFDFVKVVVHCNTFIFFKCLFVVWFNVWCLFLISLGIFFVLPWTCA